MKQKSNPVNSEVQKKNNILLKFVLCQVRLILFNTNLGIKNNISLVKIVQSQYKCKKYFG